MQKQIVILGGGDTFETYESFLENLKNSPFHIERCTTNKRDWKPWLRTELGEAYEVIIPGMPNSANAQYHEWRIVFEKIIPFLHDGVLLVGHSLGGSFLVKYLSENVFPKKIRGVFLIAACSDKDAFGYSLASFALPKKMKLRTKKVYLYQSKDDPVVPFAAMEYFKKAFPKARMRIFEDRKHINTEDFPELLADIKLIDVDRF
jgi:hypothetical protein